MTVDATRMVRIEGGTFRMGSAEFYPDETPVHERTVDAFEIDVHPVTNEQFAAFVEATGYVTVAERPLDPADFPGVDPARPRSGRARCSPRRPAPSTCATGGSGGAGARARAGGIRSGPSRRSTTSRRIRWCR